MKMRMVLSLGMSALVFGGTVVGCTAGGGTGIAAASDRSTLVAEKAAADNARRAEKAIAKRDGAAAIEFAEAAVSLSPRSASYRMLLGQSYLQGGRFVSAAQTFADVLALSPGNGKAALNHALAKVATGDWAGARKTLDANAAIIPIGDRGLAMGLAGDPAGGVALLTQAARGPDADAKIRQNLALTFALGGQWNMARAIAAADMSPADVDRRMEEWAAFAQPQAASDQIASLLGVKASEDRGLPTALALNAPTTVPAPLEVPPVAVAVVAPVAVAPAPAPVPPTVAAIATPTTVPTLLAKINFGATREVVQPLPVSLIRADAAPSKVVAKRWPVAALTRGSWFVQIGAFRDAEVAKDGWSRATRRFAGLSAHSPTGTKFTSKAGSFYRLSIGGFSRGDADAMCRRYRAAGGDCFVRAGAGDETAQWLRPAARYAARG